MFGTVVRAGRSPSLTGSEPDERGEQMQKFECRMQKLRAEGDASNQKIEEEDENDEEED